MFHCDLCNFSFLQDTYLEKISSTVLTAYSGGDKSTGLRQTAIQYKTPINCGLKKFEKKIKQLTQKNNNMSSKALQR